MRLPDRLREFFTECGVRQTWLAKKIGMKKEFLYQIMNKHTPIPIGYWPSLLRWTQGYITLEDLLRDYFNYPEILEIKGKKPTKCEISLLNINEDKD